MGVYMFSTTNDQPMFKIILWATGLMLVLIFAVILIISLVKSSYTQISIQSDISSTNLTINGENAGNAPLTTRLKPGHYKIIATTEQKKQEKEIDLVKKENSIIFFNFITPEKPQTILEDRQLNNLVTETPHFTVETSDQSGYDIIISIYATLNGSANPEADKIQLENYLQELKQYKQEALVWIQNKGTNVSQLKIKWIPKETEQY